MPRFRFLDSEKDLNMRFPNVILSLAAAGLIGAQEPKKDDAESIKGNWTAISMKQGKQSLPEGFVKSFKFGLDGKNYTNTIGTEVAEEGGYTIDASKTPKTIDFDIKKGPDAGKKQLGLYKIEGDKFTIVASPAGSAERPKSLDTEDADQVLVVVLERVKA
jgi:uncharacterized protein (TIGR03067 family)